MTSRPALVVVDVQNYYLDPAADYVRFHESIHPGALGYIARRAAEQLLPHSAQLIQFFRREGWPVVFLRLCGTAPDRSDLLPAFRRSWQKGHKAGFPGVYPLAHEPAAEVHPALAPQSGETVLDKTTFSGFTRTHLEDILRKQGAESLVFCGLATSQCVETSARDAADRGFGVVLVEDALADYEEETHHASLFASQGVCGGIVVQTRTLLTRLPEVLAAVRRA